MPEPKVMTKDAALGDQVMRLCWEGEYILAASILMHPDISKPIAILASLYAATVLGTGQKCLFMAALSQHK